MHYLIDLNYESKYLFVKLKKNIIKLNDKNCI